MANVSPKLKPCLLPSCLHAHPNPHSLLVFSAGAMCPPGSFKENEGLEANCMSCDQNAVRESFSTYAQIHQSENQTGPVPPPNSPEQCACDRQYFFNPKNLTKEEAKLADLVGLIGKCERCPDNTNCDKPGHKIENLPVDEGFWRSSGER